MTKPLNFISKFLGIGLLVALVAVFLFLLKFLVVMYYAQASAYALAPAEYPNSELVEKWQSGGSDLMWDRRTYRTSDNVDQVFLFFEEQMPGFTVADSEMGSAYGNFAENHNWLARQAAKQACRSLYCIEESAFSYPTASVKFYPDPDNPTGTLIEVWLSWPG